jgi:peptide deformylase
VTIAHLNQTLASWTPAQLGLVGDVLEVIRAPHPVLATESAEIDPLDPVMVALAADLVATMRVAPGCVGLAAPQVGVAAQMFALDVTGHPKTRTCHGVFVLCNAVVIDASRRERSREGCMSVPDLTGDVKRATRLTVTGVLPGTTDEVTLSTDAFEARAVQHEIDHCSGKLFLDRVAGAHAVFPRQIYL